MSRQLKHVGSGPVWVFEPPTPGRLKLGRLPSVRRFNEDTESLCSWVSRWSRSVATKDKLVKDQLLGEPKPEEYPLPTDETLEVKDIDEEPEQEEEPSPDN